MPAALSLDIRTRFQRYIEEGMSGREAARRLLISPATASRLVQRLRDGRGLVPLKCGRPDGWGPISAHKAFLVELVEQDPDITMVELQAALMDAEGVDVHPTSLSRALRQFGYTFKKKRWQRTNAAAAMSPMHATAG